MWSYILSSLLLTGTFLVVFERWVCYTISSYSDGFSYSLCQFQVVNASIGYYSESSVICFFLGVLTLCRWSSARRNVYRMVSGMVWKWTFRPRPLARPKSLIVKFSVLIIQLHLLTLLFLKKWETPAEEIQPRLFVVAFHPKIVVVVRVSGLYKVVFLSGLSPCVSGALLRQAWQHFLLFINENHILIVIWRNWRIGVNSLYSELELEAVCLSDINCIRKVLFLIFFSQLWSFPLLYLRYSSFCRVNSV